MFRVRRCSVAPVSAARDEALRRHAHRVGTRNPDYSQAGRAVSTVMLGTLAAADGPVSPKRQFNPMTGTVAIGDGLATVKLPPDLAFLGKDDANWMLEQEWENPHDPSVIGLVIGKEKFEPIAPVFVTGFTGLLCLFLLERKIRAKEVVR